MKTKSTLLCFVVAYCVNTYVTVYAQAVNKQDSLALVDLYNSTAGDKWNYNTNWLSGPVSSWYGVTVSEGKITAIYLHLNNLTGTIPSSLGSLADLTSLNLSSNQLTGSIPSSLGNLRNLKVLGLDENQLSGIIPSSFGDFINISSLSLSRNQLSGAIPFSLGNLVGLRYLNLFHNQLSGGIPSSLGNLIYVEDLSLSHNQLSGNIPSSLGNLINMYNSLDLSHNQLRGNIPSSLSNLVNMYYPLDLSNNQLSGTIPFSLQNLNALDLSNNQLTGNIPFSSGNLTYLDLSNNKLSGGIPSSLGKFYLGYLDLNGNQLSGSIPSSLADLPIRYAFNLSNNRFTFDGMELIARKFRRIAIYDKQKRIPLNQHGNTLSVSAGGTLSNNTYYWCKVGKNGLIHVATIKGDSVFHPSESDNYVVAVTNSVATQLTLYSQQISYTESFVSNNFTSVSSENVLQQFDKANLFFIYPNPAKDILHVQTNNTNSFSFINQAGKILLTTIINGNGTINVSRFPAGLYYLRSNSTKSVQKVIISR